jgi:hypothetical protein
MKKITKSGNRNPRHTWEIVGTLIAIILITIPGALDAYRGDNWSSTKAGEFGDFVGGYFGTVFLVISVAVVVGSYRNQRAYERTTAFESRFFELLRYHRDNTAEIEVEGLKGRRAFVSFLREWRLLIQLVRFLEGTRIERLNVRQRASLSYLAFFHGSGPNGRRALEKAAHAAGHSTSVVDSLVGCMSHDWTVYSQQRRGKSPRPELCFGTVSESELRPLAYVPYEGHHSRLAHYFRHLLHLVRYACEHSPKGTAAEYIDLVRAQLTTHEQAIFALHISGAAGPSTPEERVQRYQLINDIPAGFFSEDEFDLNALSQDAAPVHPR